MSVRVKVNLSRVLVPLVLIPFFVGTCACSRSPLYSGKLSTGKRIKVISLDKVDLEASGPTLSLHYVTAIPISDRKALQREVEEISLDLRKEAERRRLNTVVIWAGEQPIAGLSTGFMLRRRPDGNWYKASGFTNGAGKVMGSSL